jgi:hypothetical protein
MFLGNFVLVVLAAGLVFGDEHTKARRSGDHTYYALHNFTRSVDADGGEGDFTKACALSGFYEFTAQYLVTDCTSSPAQLVVHFHAKEGGICVADITFTSFSVGFCARNVVGSRVYGNTFQMFFGTSNGGHSFGFDVIAMSQSQPVIVIGDCCLDGTPMVGTPVEDIDAAGLRYCGRSIDWSSC